VAIDPATTSGYLPVDDLRLMNRVRAGDATAEAELYVLHRVAAVRRAVQFGAQPADAEDYVHEAFVRVIRQLRKGGGPDGAFRPYLIAAVRNAAMDAHRGQRGRESPTAELSTSLESLLQAVDPQYDAEQRVCVRTAMQSLPQRWKDVLWLIDVEGHTPKSIAGATGVSAQSVSALAYRARRALRRAYENALLPTAS
jgi:RNA polymerase sigma factor (sigma-70 family)